MDNAPSGCDVVCENSSPSGFTASNRLLSRLEPLHTLVLSRTRWFSLMLTKLYTKNFVCIWGYYDYRFNEDSSYEEPVATYSPEPIAICSPERPLSYNDQQSESSLPRLLANDIDTIFSGFPPSFTELLTNCSTETEKGYSSKLTFITKFSHL